MATIRLTCPKPKGCGRKFSRPMGSRRKYCEACSPPRKPPLALREAPQPVDPSVVGPLEARLRVELEEAGVVGSTEALGLLSVARDVDLDRIPPQQKPRVVQQLIQMRDAALGSLKSASGPGDRLDELARRRAERGAS